MSADSIIPAGPNYCTGLLFLLSKRDRAGEETDVSEAQQAEAVRRRVLIAEDEALIRLDLAEMLAEEGYEVVGEAGDGETAVRLAHELRPDLVILDIKMPVMDGLAAAEKIAEAHLAPVLILTAFSQRDLVERAKGALMTTYGMTEPQAFKWIQRTAMDHRMGMREVAERIIAETSGGAT